tara:strand:+ start:476 stop:598 length:123 start_codon:yes stop_codon:yes gene_type:complete
MAEPQQNSHKAAKKNNAKLFILAPFREQLKSIYRLSVKKI